MDRNTGIMDLGERVTSEVTTQGLAVTTTHRWALQHPQVGPSKRAILIMTALVVGHRTWVIWGGTVISGSHGENDAEFHMLFDIQEAIQLVAERVSK